MHTRELSSLKPHPQNPRGKVTVDSGLRELAASIESQGILQPILITLDGTIVAGHRRVKAAKVAGLDRVPVIVKELTESEQLQIMLVENLQRENLTALQTARAYQQLVDAGLSITEISKAIGYHYKHVSNYLSILKLPSGLHDSFDRPGGLPLGSAKFLLELPSDQQLAIGKVAEKNQWLISDIRRAVAQIVKKEKRVREFQTGIDETILERVWDRLQDGCYDPDTIMKCGECGHPLFNLSTDELKRYLQRLVNDERAEWRKEGGKKATQRGDRRTLCVPKDTPSGDVFDLSRMADGEADDLAA